MIYLLSLIVFLLPSYLVKFSIFGIPTTLLEILIYLATIITIIVSIKNTTLKKDFNLIFKSNFFIPSILFLLSGIISVIIAPDKTSALGFFKAYLIDPILIFYILIINITSKKDIKLLINSLIFSGVILSFYAIYQALIGDSTIDGRVVSIYKYWPDASANYLSLYLAPIVVLIAGVSYLNEKKFKWTSILYDVAFFICVIGMLLTQSRAAAGIVIIGLFILALYRFWSYIKKHLWLKIILFGLIFIGALFSYQTLKPDYTLSPETGGRITASNNIRFEIYSTTINILKTKWLTGVGLGNYQNYFGQLTKNQVNYPEFITPFAITPHNLFLTIWVNLGILGLVSFIWILVIFVKNINKHDKYSIILLVTMFCLLIYGMIDTPYWKNDLAAYFWILLALGCSIYNLSDSNNKG